MRRYSSRDRRAAAISPDSSRRSVPSALRRTAARLIGTSALRQAAALSVAMSALAAGIWAVTPAQAAPTPPATVPVQVVTDAHLPGHTVYRPAELAPHTPVLVWGEGGCITQGSLYHDFLSTVAARGVVVIANAEPYGVGLLDQSVMNASVDWAVAKNNRPDSPYAGRLDAAHIAVAGWSCGGLQSYGLAVSRPEIATVGILNSGQLTVDQSQLDRLRVPILYVLGGSWDVAYQNGIRDFQHLPPTLPAFLGSRDTGHLGTYFEPGGGQYASILGDWIRWQIAGDQRAGQTFTGPACGLCAAPGWTVQRHNIG